MFLHTARPVIAGEADAAAVRRLPLVEIGKLGEEGAEFFEISRAECAIAFEYPMAGFQRDRRQHLRWPGIAYGKVVFHAFHALEKRVIAAGDPADPKPRKAIGLGHDVERNTAVEEFGRLRQALLLVALQPSIDLIAEKMNAALGAECRERAKDRRLGDSARRVIGEIDRDQLRIRLQRRLDIGDIELPIVLGTECTPLTEAAIVTGRVSIDW